MPKRLKPAPEGRNPGLTPDEELDNAFGESLLRELTATYAAWRDANRGKCAMGEVAHALIYFAGGALVEMGLHARLPALGHWPSFMGDCQDMLRNAMTYWASARILVKNSRIAEQVHYPHLPNPSRLRNYR
jgi:hypothetical protein